jgi:hypothetical protein
MSVRNKLWLKAAIVGGCIESAAWLLCLWADCGWPAHPEDTIPMLMFNITQIPSIFLGGLLLPLMRLIGIPDTGSAVISSIVISVVQAFIFAVLTHLLLYKPEKGKA